MSASGRAGGCCGRCSYGDGEALAHLALPDAYEADLAHYPLHPALLDYATGYAMELIEGYERRIGSVDPGLLRRIVVHAPLEKRVSSWVRLRGRRRRRRAISPPST